MGQASSVQEAYSAVGGCTSVTSTTTVFPTFALVTPTPKPSGKLLCGVPGEIPSPPPESIFNTIGSITCRIAPENENADAAADPETYCAQLCDGANSVEAPKNCVSFQYDSEADVCTLYNKSLLKLGLKKKPATGANQAKKNYHKNCFTATTTTATVTSTTYSWCAESPTQTVFLNKPDRSYPNYCDATSGISEFPVILTAFQQKLPFPLKLYEEESSGFYMSTDGMLGVIDGVSLFRSLPNLPMGTLAAETTAVAPFWTTSQINNHTSQGLSYKVAGPEGSRVATFRWNLASAPADLSFDGSGTQRYVFFAVYREANPGVWTFRYKSIPDGGVNATVGMQDMTAPGEFPFISPEYIENTYSYNEDKITNGLKLEFDSMTNEFSVLS